MLGLKGRNAQVYRVSAPRVMRRRRVAMGNSWECRVPSRHNRVSRNTAGRGGTRPSRNSNRLAPLSGSVEFHLDTTASAAPTLVEMELGLPGTAIRPLPPAVPPPGSVEFHLDTTASAAASLAEVELALPGTATRVTHLLGVSSSTSTQPRQPHKRWPRWNSAFPEQQPA